MAPARARVRQSDSVGGQYRGIGRLGPDSRCGSSGPRGAAGLPDSAVLVRRRLLAFGGGQIDRRRVIALAPSGLTPPPKRELCLAGGAAPRLRTVAHFDDEPGDVLFGVRVARALRCPAPLHARAAGPRSGLPAPARAPAADPDPHVRSVPGSGRTIGVKAAPRCARSTRTITDVDGLDAGGEGRSGERLMRDRVPWLWLYARPGCTRGLHMTRCSS
jgi:hypothetical protein